MEHGMVRTIYGMEVQINSMQMHSRTAWVLTLELTLDIMDIIYPKRMGIFLTYTTSSNTLAMICMVPLAPFIHEAAVVDVALSMAAVVAATFLLRLKVTIHH